MLVGHDILTSLLVMAVEGAEDWQTRDFFCWYTGHWQGKLQVWWQAGSRGVTVDAVAEALLLFAFSERLICHWSKYLICPGSFV